MDQAGMLWLHFTRGFEAENLSSGFGLMCSLWLSLGESSGTRLPEKGLWEAERTMVRFKFIFKEEPTGFRDGFDACCEKKRSQI